MALPWCLMMAKWKICADPSCMTAVPKGTGRCAQHAKEEKARQVGWIDRPSQRNTGGRATGHKWMRIRRRILERDFGLCQVCKAQGLIRSGQEVDHIDNEGSDDEDNLQVICIEHHRVKSRAESIQGGRRVRAD